MPQPRFVRSFVRCLLLTLAAAPWATLNRAALAQEYPNVVTADPLSAAEQLKKFHLPPGFEIQLVAAEPEVIKPINLNFDDRGRLFFSQSVEYPFPAKPGTTGRDTVRVIEGFDDSGRATKISTFVDGLNIPIGVTPIAGGAIVYSIPNIYRCLDPQNVGHATERSVLYGPFEFRDTHGMNSSFTRGLDGWIYANHGFTNDDTITGKDGKQIKMQSGNTYRMRPDGSRIEYFAHGRVNPFGIAMDPLDNMYSSDCETLPAYTILRGGYYPSFGKPDDGLGFAPPMLSHHHGPTAIGGIVYYAAEQFPAEYHDALFIGNPVSHRVCWDKLESRGSFFWAVEQPDFIKCDDPWFRPVDLKLGPDGAIYMADFYNRIIGHYEVPLTHPGRDHDHGRIWRIVYVGTKDKPAAKAVAANLATADLEHLIASLADPNLTVRTLATHELVDRIGKDAVIPLKKLLASDSSRNWQRAHGLWVLERLDSLDNDLVTRLASDQDRLVRVHLVKALAERSDWQANAALDTTKLVRSKLTDPDAFVRRAATEALGRHPALENVKLLADVWAKAPADDTHLIHVARMALRDQLAAPGMYTAMEKAGIPGGDRNLRARLAEVSLAIANTDSATFLTGHFSDQPDGRLVHHLTRYLPTDKLPELFKSFAASRQAADDPNREFELLRSAQQGLQERGGQTLPAEMQSWAGELAIKLLARDNSDQVTHGIELARDFHVAGALQPMFALVSTSKFEALRPAAIDACVAIDRQASVPMLSDLIGRGGESLSLRQKAAQALAAVNSDPSRAELLKQLTAAPERLAVDIAAGLAGSKPGAESLLATIATGKASPRMLREPTVVDRLRAHKLPNFDVRLKELTAGLPAGDQRLNQLIAQRREGFVKFKSNPDEGHKGFNKICAACHKIGDEGHKIGPQLDGIGVRGVDRLLEDVLDPNRNVDQAFRATRIVTADGRLTTGLVLREEGEVLILADANGKEIRVAKTDIGERQVSLLSPMPANVADLLNEQEFYNLLAYLLSQKPK